MSGDSDMAANAWPGFVDILSAVVIMFVFFVLIIAAVLYFYTITYKARVQGELVEEVVEVGIGAQQELVEELQRQNNELRTQIEAQLEKISESGGSSEVETENETQAAQSFGMQANEQTIMSSDDEQTLVLFHDPGAITVDDVSEQRIGEFIQKMADSYGGEQLEIVMTSPKVENAATQTRAKRLAVARMLNVRNALLNSPIPRDKIKLTVVESEAIEDSNDWTKLQVNVTQ